MGINDAYDVLACLLLGEDALRVYAGGGKLNTDNHPRLEYSLDTAYLNTSEHAKENLVATRPLRESAWPIIYNIGSTGEETVLQKLTERIATTSIEYFWPIYFREPRVN